LKIISKEESEELIRRYTSQAEDYNFAIAPTGIPCLLMKNSSAIIANSDESVTWFARAISLDAHTFIELKTGEKKTKTIYIPICLVNAKSRQVAEALLNTTIDPLDGRFGSKDAEVIIITPDGKGFMIHFELKVLALSYLSFQMFPQDYVLQLKSNHCRFCEMAAI
jgi:hypothetical protein